MATYTGKRMNFPQGDDEFILDPISKMTKSDVTALGIPGQDTTYDPATSSSDGLMSSTDKTKLDGLSESTLREVPFAVATSEWTLSSGVYTAEFTTEYVTASSKEMMTFDSSLRTYGKGDISAEKKSGGGGIVFTTAVIPTGTISGTIYVMDDDDGKIPVILENTVVPIANGGTGAASLAGAQANLGINQKITNPSGSGTNKFLRTDSNGAIVWGDQPSASEIADDVSDWLDEHVSGGTTIALDDTLTIPGAAADAAKVGSELGATKSALTQETENSDSNNDAIIPGLKKEQILKNSIANSILVGNLTSGKAWRKNRTEASGENYCYAVYDDAEISANPGSFLVVSGYSWSVNSTLICFYDSSDNFVASFGNEPTGMAHNYNIIPIPYNASYAVVNGKTTTNPPSVAYLGKSSLKMLLSNQVGAFATIVNAAFIANNSSYAYLRNFPNNAIYNIGNDVNGVILDLPSGMTTYGTLIKTNGNSGENVNGYSFYIMINPSEMWFGWDDGSSIKWTRANINNFPSAHIFNDYESITGTETTGKAKNKNGTSEASNTNYVYITYSITGAERVIINGYHFSNNYPAYIVLDSNSNVIDKLTDETAGTKSIVYDAPNQAAQIIVNGFIGTTGGNGYPEIKKLTGTENLHETLLKIGTKKRYLFIGDSYCQGYSHDGNNSGWAHYCANRMGLETTDYVRSSNGGAAFAKTENNYTALIPMEYPADYFTDIVVCGGYNDHAFTEAQILDGMEAFVTLARAKYPYAKIHFGFIAWNKAGNGEGAEPNWEEYHAALINTVLPAYLKCTKFNVPYLVNVEYWINDSLITNSDGYHPSADGNKSLGQAIAHALLSGSSPLPYSEFYRVGN